MRPSFEMFRFTQRNVSGSREPFFRCTLNQKQQVKYLNGTNQYKCIHTQYIPFCMTHSVSICHKDGKCTYSTQSSTRLYLNAADSGALERAEKACNLNGTSAIYQIMRMTEPYKRKILNNASAKYRIMRMTECKIPNNAHDRTQHARTE